MAGDRQGLLGAILHPDSSRTVADTVAVAPDRLPVADTDGSDAPKQTPWPLSVPLALALFALFTRRLQMD